MPIPEFPGVVDDQSMSAPHVVERDGSTDPAAPLVVLLHGRGAGEREILALADHLPSGRRSRRSAPRSPRAAATPGSPTAASAVRSRSPSLIHGVVPGLARPGCSGGPPGGARRFQRRRRLRRRADPRDPQRFAGAAILYGTLPFEAGVPVTPARLAGLPVFRRPGRARQVIPRRAAGPHLAELTWFDRRPSSPRDPGGNRATAGHLGEASGAGSPSALGSSRCPGAPTATAGVIGRRARRAPPSGPAQRPRGLMDDPAGAASRQCAAEIQEGCCSRRSVPAGASPSSAVRDLRPGRARLHGEPALEAPAGCVLLGPFRRGVRPPAPRTRRVPPSGPAAGTRVATPSPRAGPWPIRSPASAWREAW